MAINETWRLAPWADVLYGADWRWWWKRGPAPEDFKGLRLVAQTKDEPEEWPGCVSVRVCTSWNKLILKGKMIASGGASGFQAANLAIRWGAKRILLTGMDCKGDHWHGKHGDGLNNPHFWLYRTWLESWATAGQQAREIGVDLINCSRDTAIPEMDIPRARLEDAL